MEEEKAEGGDVIADFKYLIGSYRKKWSQTLCRQSVKGLEAMGTSFRDVNSDCIEGKKKVVRGASWTGCGAFVFGNIQNSSGNCPEQPDITLKLVLL